MAKVVKKAGPGRAALQALAVMHDNVVRAGWFDTSKYENGTSVAYVASIHEFGFAPKNIPPRLGLRQMLVDNQPQYTGLSERMAKLVLRGGNAMKYLEAIGGKLVGDIQKRISDNDIELKKSTLRNRAYQLGIKFDELTSTAEKPLVEPARGRKAGMERGGTGGLLLATVTYIVGTKGNEP